MSVNQSEQGRGVSGPRVHDIRLRPQDKGLLDQNVVRTINPEKADLWQDFIETAAGALSGRIVPIGRDENLNGFVVTMPRAPRDDDDTYSRTQLEFYPLKGEVHLRRQRRETDNPDIVISGITEVRKSKKRGKLHVYADNGSSSAELIISPEGDYHYRQTGKKLHHRSYWGPPSEAIDGGAY